MVGRVEVADLDLDLAAGLLVVPGLAELELGGVGLSEEVGLPVRRGALFEVPELLKVV